MSVFGDLRSWEISEYFLTFLGFSEDSDKKPGFPTWLAACGIEGAGLGTGHSQAFQPQALWIIPAACCSCRSFLTCPLCVGQEGVGCHQHFGADSNEKMVIFGVQEAKGIFGVSLSTFSSSYTNQNSCLYPAHPPPWSWLRMEIITFKGASPHSPGSASASQNPRGDLRSWNKFSSSDLVRN